MYNVRKQLKLESLAGKTPIESLIIVLQSGEYVFDYKTDIIGCVSHLFFAHPKSIELLHHFPELVLLDYTYKTNKFKLPLLNIVGTTYLNSTFHMTFCFMAKEDKESYFWVLEQLKKLYESTSDSSIIVMDRDLALMAAAW